MAARATARRCVSRLARAPSRWCTAWLTRAWVAPPAKESHSWSYYPPVGKFDSIPYWQKLKVPALVLYGERDAIEDIAAYSLRADGALHRAGNRDFTVAILPRALHELKIDAEPGAAFEWRHPSPGLYDLMIAWIKRRGR